MINPRKSPYHGQFISIIILVLPPLALVALFYGAFKLCDYQPNDELNWISSKMFGCGLGILFHLSCWLMSAFKQDILVVKERLKDFFGDLFISPKSAFKWYFYNIKENGISFWIDLGFMLANAWIFVDSIFEYIEVGGTF